MNGKKKENRKQWSREKGKGRKEYKKGDVREDRGKEMKGDTIIKLKDQKFVAVLTFMTGGVFPFTFESFPFKVEDIFNSGSFKIIFYLK